MSVTSRHALKYPISTLLLILLWSSVALATSRPPHPLRGLSYPITHALEILPRQDTLDPLQRRAADTLRTRALRHSDRFRLTLTAFDVKYHLHLRPNDHLIHPAARINYYRSSSRPGSLSVLDRSEPLLRENVLVYEGDVVPSDATDLRLRQDAAGVLSPTGSIGWARVMIHSQGDLISGEEPIYEGAFVGRDGVIHHIVTKQNYQNNKVHHDLEVSELNGDARSSLVVYRDTDFVIPDGRNGLFNDHHHQSCSHDTLSFNTDARLNSVLQFHAPDNWYERLRAVNFPPAALRGNISLTRRDDVAGGNASTNFINTIGQTTGCPKSQQIVYMGVAADCEYVKDYGGMTQNATTQIIKNWNTATSLYKSTFNVSLGIIELDIHDGSCPTTADPQRPWNVGCSDSITLNDRLSLFSQWRGDKGADGAGLWHLMSGCPTGTEVGVAWLGTLCQTRSSGQGDNVVSGTAVSTSGNTEWQVVAHEIGHNFGAIHDCADGCNTTSPCCPLTVQTCNANAGFLMSPVSAANEKTFSACSIGNICSLMQGNTNTTCLQSPDPTRQTISLQMCGNGIVEAGEDCDPGQGQTSSCCNASTCKFTANAQCDPASSPCCQQSCQFAPSSQVCRPSRDSACDQVEMCTGNSSSCPSDVTTPNGQSCGADGLACAAGICTSPSAQCQKIGASMNLTKACPNRSANGCQVACQDPLNPSQCVILQAQLVDGSPCGLGGTCAQGVCQAGSALDTAKSWYTQNLQISIPVTIVVGLLALVILYALLRWMARFCFGKRSRFRQSEPALRRSTQLVPNVLRPGSEEALLRTPPVAHSRSRSVAARDHTPVPSSAWHNRSQSHPATPWNPPRPHNRAHWVDETQYNGLPRR